MSDGDVVSAADDGAGVDGNGNRRHSRAGGQRGRLSALPRLLLRLEQLEVFVAEMGRTHHVPSLPRVALDNALEWASGASLTAQSELDKLARRARAALTETLRHGAHAIVVEKRSASSGDVAAARATAVVSLPALAPAATIRTGIHDAPAHKKGRVAAQAEVECMSGAEDIGADSDEDGSGDDGSGDGNGGGDDDSGEDRDATPFLSSMETRAMGTRRDDEVGESSMAGEAATVEDDHDGDDDEAGHVDGAVEADVGGESVNDEDEESEEDEYDDDDDGEMLEMDADEDCEGAGEDDEDDDGSDEAARGGWADGYSSVSEDEGCALSDLVQQQGDTSRGEAWQARYVGGSASRIGGAGHKHSDGDDESMLDLAPTLVIDFRAGNQRQRCDGERGAPHQE